MSVVNFAICIIVVVIIIAGVSLIIKWKNINVWPEGFDDEQDEVEKSTSQYPKFEFPSINRDSFGRWFSE